MTVADEVHGLSLQIPTLDDHGMKIAVEDRGIGQEQEGSIVLAPVNATPWEVLVTERSQGAVHLLRLRPGVDMPFFNRLESTDSVDAASLVCEADKLMALTRRNEPEDADFPWWSFTRCFHGCIYVRERDYVTPKSNSDSSLQKCNSREPRKFEARLATPSVKVSLTESPKHTNRSRINY